MGCHARHQVPSAADGDCIYCYFFALADFEDLAGLEALADLAVAAGLADLPLLAAVVFFPAAAVLAAPLLNA